MLSAYRPWSYLLCRWGCSSQRCICCWHSVLWGHITVSLSSRFLTSRLEGRHWCSCSRWRSTGQKSCSFKKLLRQWKQYVWPQGVSIGLMRGCRQMWQTSSSSTSSWYSYRWLSRPSCCWPHSLQTRAHDRPGALPTALVSVAAMSWLKSVQTCLFLGKKRRPLISVKTLFGETSRECVCVSKAKIHSQIQSQNNDPESKMLSPRLHLDFLLRERHSKLQSRSWTISTHTDQLHRKWQIHRAAAIWHRAAAASSQLVSWGTKGILISAKKSPCSTLKGLNSVKWGKRKPD